jgi:phage terminase large subunit
MMAVARGERRISVRSGHGVGKTTTLAWIKIWWIFTRFPQKTICTAPTQDQLFDALASETKAWMTKLPAPLQAQFEILAESIFFKAAPDESFISYRTSRPDKPEAMAGVHSDNVLLIGDEASGIPEAVFEAGAGSMSGHNAVTILAGNPVRGTGYFYETFHHNAPDWYKVHVSCVNHPRVSPDFVSQIRNTYGELSNAFRVRVLGEFPIADDDTIIPAELVDSALDRAVEPLKVQEIWGVDVARFGGDNSALARRKGNVLVKPVETKNGYDTMRVAGWIKHEWDTTLPSERPSDIFIDVIGIGAGVVDRLSEQGLPVRGINVSESPALFEDRYNNQRTELLFKARDWLAAKDCSLRGDAQLARELKIPKYKFTSSGKMQAEAKSEIKKRNSLASPDLCDAFVLTLAGDAVSTISSPATKTSWKTALKRNIKGLV